VTDRLYYTDATCTTFAARVIHVNADRTRVVLDRSAFYPTSGGQPHDLGTLAGVAVVDVVEDGDAVVHVLAAPLPADADAVEGQVDWTRRHDHMQQHSGQHLLSAILEDEYGWPTVSVHFGRESSTLDVVAESISPETLVAVEERANALVAEHRAIHVSFEDAASATGLRKPSDRSGQLRIVTIDGLDRNACGGTHVAHTGAIGPITFRRTERMRGTTRVEFRCGGRAIARARHDLELLQRLAAGFSSAIDDLPDLVAGMQGEVRELHKERERLLEQLAGHEARALHAAAQPDRHGRRVAQQVLPQAPVRDAQRLAQQYALEPRAVFVASSGAPPALLVAASADAGIDCGRVVREALQAVGGRGGGSPRLAQGSAPDPDSAAAALALVLAALDH
jgi:alanyl-tRNA synthetase